jgi:hypothetical protein
MASAALSLARDAARLPEALREEIAFAAMRRPDGALAITPNMDAIRARSAFAPPPTCPAAFTGCLVASEAGDIWTLYMGICAWYVSMARGGRFPCDDHDAIANYTRARLGQPAVLTLRVAEDGPLARVATCTCCRLICAYEPGTRPQDVVVRILHGGYPVVRGVDGIERVIARTVGDLRTWARRFLV